MRREEKSKQSFGLTRSGDFKTTQVTAYRGSHCLLSYETVQLNKVWSRSARLGISTELNY